MAEYIDREAVIKKIDNLETPVFYANGNLEWYQDGFKDALKEVNKILDNQPTADVAEVKHAHWAETEATMNTKVVFCTNCFATYQFEMNDTDLFDYCPKCGAKMDK